MKHMRICGLFFRLFRILEYFILYFPLYAKNEILNIQTRPRSLKRTYLCTAKKIEKSDNA